MKLFIVAALLSVAYAGRLDNTYLPPSSAASAGGAGLAAPFGAASSGFAKVAAPPVAILKYSNDNNEDGSYAYNYETADGSSASEQGYLNNAGNPETESLVSQGSYSYTGPDGQVYTVTYTADENGFRAEGAHLPTPPPIPEAIQRSLEIIAAAEAAKAKSGAQGGFQGYSGSASAQQPGYSYLPPQ